MRQGSGAGLWAGLGIATLALLALGAPRASACGLLWACSGERAYTAHRPAHRVRAYRPRYRLLPRSSYRHRHPAWGYGYANPARGYGDAYAPWPSTSMPQARWYLRTALPVPNAETMGLSAPAPTSREFVLKSAMPSRGPTLLGPRRASTAGYYYYGAPAYGYARAYGSPPPDTPSWWIEPRRRR